MKATMNFMVSKNMAGNSSITVIRRNVQFTSPLIFRESSLRYFYCALRQSAVPLNATALPQTIQRTFDHHQFFLGHMQIPRGGLDAEVS